MIAYILLICMAWLVEMPLALSICITVFSALSILFMIISKGFDVKAD